MPTYIARITVNYKIQGENKGEYGSISYYYERTYYGKKAPGKVAMRNFRTRANKHAGQNIYRYNKKAKAGIKLTSRRTSIEQPVTVEKGFSKRYTNYRAVRRQKNKQGVEKAYWIRGNKEIWLKIKR